jgi:acyl-coenzyme A synthetase/AMP-(fatty) acid ligase
MFTAPTAIRAIKKEDPDGELLKSKNLSNLKTLFLAGERCDPTTFHWVNDLLNISVIDQLVANRKWLAYVGYDAGYRPIAYQGRKCRETICGFDVQILEDDGNSIFNDNEEGYIAVKLPLPPGCLQTLWKNDKWFRRIYIASRVIT